MQKIITVVVSLFLCASVWSQNPKTTDPAQLYEKIQKLNFLGTALYVAAHPDDENTSLISYLANHEKARTGYLSLTRGDGGQNLIGTELREFLGVLRTQELLAARRIDGGEQFFSRANDFGYSKHPDETLAFWNEKEVLGDVISRIRQFRPDVIINRFDHRTPGTTHGHHTTSAILSVAAFDKAGDPSVYPEQLATVEPWQPKRLFFNTSWWFYGSQEKFDKADKSKLTAINSGVYYPLKGMSNGEIAGLSRSQHRCQGFGTSGKRGDSDEYLELIKGDMPATEGDLFAGINTTWTRVKGGKAIGNILNKIEANFNFIHPEKHLDDLVKAYKLINELEDDYWRTYKLEQITDIILSCTGLYIQPTVNAPYTTPGSTADFSVELINRSGANIQLSQITTNFGGQQTLNQPLSKNKDYGYDMSVVIPKNTNYTTPYWLLEKGTTGMYHVANKNLIGKPETPPALIATITLLINKVPIEITKPVVYKNVTPDKGENYQPFHILPEVTADIVNDVIIFATSESKEIVINVHAQTNNLKGSVSLDIPDGWTVSPSSAPIAIARKNDIQQVTFTVTPPKTENVGSITPVVTTNNGSYHNQLTTISYDHIPTQYVLMPSETKVVRLNIQKAGEHIGYIAGAGDKIPESLKEIGYYVSIINPEAITTENLANYDAVVIGIRAYNVVDNLQYKQQYLEEYVNQGGTVIVQYNTNRGLTSEHLAPFELHLSRDRVTDEESEVKLLAKDHPALNFPNTITTDDFNGWTQERGLYFPDEWGKEFTPILGMHDKGESTKKGSLLVAKYGKGYYIYTGLSFFRELPAGVPGAFKLFTNLMSIGKSSVETDKIKG